MEAPRPLPEDAERPPNSQKPLLKNKALRRTQTGCQSKYQQFGEIVFPQTACPKRGLTVFRSRLLGHDLFVPPCPPGVLPVSSQFQGPVAIGMLPMAMGTHGHGYPRPWGNGESSHSHEYPWPWGVLHTAMGSTPHGHGDPQEREDTGRTPGGGTKKQVSQQPAPKHNENPLWTSRLGNL